MHVSLGQALGHSRTMVAMIGLLLVGTTDVVSAEPAGGQRGAYRDTFTTHHEGTFGGHRIHYRATMKSTVLTDDDGRPTVSFVTTDYVRSDVRDAKKRPVIFAWGGGPSVPSTYFHLYLLGPYRAKSAPDVLTTDASGFAENPDSVLDIADLVFVDPAETGFSRILAEDQRSYFYSIEGDAKSLIALMERWLKENGREDSPRYLLGSSYGSVRAIRIASELAKTRAVDGIVVTANSAMVQETERTGSIIGYAAGLPTMAVAAVYHGQIERRGRSDREIIDEAYDFAMNEYLPALATVQDLQASKREAIANRLSVFTSISPQLILDNDLALTRDIFRTNLLKGRNRTLTDQWDASRTGVPTDPKATPTLLKKYLAEVLGVTYSMDEYVGYAPGARQWDFRAADGSPGNDWPTLLRQVMEANPKLRVLSANGTYDMMSTVGQVRYLMARTKLPRDRVAVKEYPGGHTLFLEPATAKALLEDIRQLIDSRLEVN